jgi:hypothetical protein
MLRFTLFALSGFVIRSGLIHEAAAGCVQHVNAVEASAGAQLSACQLARTWATALLQVCAFLHLYTSLDSAAAADVVSAVKSWAVLWALSGARRLTDTLLYIVQHVSAGLDERITAARFPRQTSGSGSGSGSGRRRAASFRWPPR